MNPKKLIGLVGLRGSGKDTAAEALIRDGYENVKFAGALKEMLRALYNYSGFPSEIVEASIEGSLKEFPVETFGGKSARFLMQTLGTEWGRDIVDSNIWVNAAVRRCQLFCKVVVSDVRFPNEVDALRGIGGKIIRVKRSNLHADSHPSEALVNDLYSDVVVYNDGTIEQLHERVRREVSQL